MEVNEINALELMNSAVKALPAYRDEFEGRGIVIPAGGCKYFACAWVCIHMLRRFGCQLPIELWHLGPLEMSGTMRRLVEPLGVRCVDAYEVRKRHPARILNGYEIKPYAIIHSRFREVLLLDADNVPVVDPTFLFDSVPYRECGAIFWPDYNRLGEDRAIWPLTGVAYQDEPEFETGQIFVDKERCWRALMLTMWMNEHSDFWYRHVHGDKETFHLAWRKLNVPYAMPPYAIHKLPSVMCQHDFEGRRIFQHRNFSKWSLYETNPRISGFLYEPECLGLLDDLKVRWKELVMQGYNSAERAMHELIARQRHYKYVRVGYDQRPMELMPDGSIGTGSERLERTWQIEEKDRRPLLQIQGEAGVICELELQDSRSLHGTWLLFERMPIQLIPMDFTHE